MNVQKSDKGRIILFSVCYVVLYLVSSAAVFGLENTVLGIKPDILLAMAVICPLFCDKKVSVVLALAVGTLADLSVTPPFHFSPVVFVLCAFFVPRIISGFSKIGVAEAAVCGLPFVILRAITGIFYLLSQYENTTFSEVFTKCILPEMFCNIAVIIIVYYLMSALIRVFRLEHRRF